MIPNETIDQILDKTDIVEVISAYIPLKKAGQNFKTNCPFHEEKTPSFSVSPSKQIYHCFGCGAGGNVISFLMKHENMDFIEAIKMLAGKAAVNLPLLTASGQAKNSFAEKLYCVNDIACSFYQENLRKTSSESPYSYLVERGLNERAIKHFGFGLAGNSWQALLDHCRAKGLEPDILSKAGLILQNTDTGNWYDRFRDRIMFPIFDSRGRTLGFGGRAMDENTMPKYINSPETHIYTKGRHLYGLNFSREFIKKQNYVIIVEGYFDLIIPFQNDIKNIVATLGTALTSEQITLIKRLTKNVIMVYDSDKAGEAATLRGLELLIREDMNIRIAALPKGADPDSFVRTEKRPGFMKVLKESKDLFDYKLDVLVSKFKKSEPRGKARIVEEMLPTLSKIKNAVLKSSYLKKMAEALSVDEESVRTELLRLKPDPAEAYSPGPDAGQRVRKNLAELTILAIALEDTSFVKRIEEELGFGSFKDESVSAVLKKVEDFHKNGKKISPSHLISYFEDRHIENVVSEAVNIGATMKDKSKGFSDCVRYIKRQNLREALRGSADMAEVNRLLKSTVSKDLKNI